MLNRRKFPRRRGCHAAHLLSRIQGAAQAAPPCLAAPVPQVPPFDSIKLRPSDFSDADLDMPYNLTYLPRIANAIETDGPDRGFINISVWRGTAQLHPYNARIMESILTLAWFYASPPQMEPVLRQPRPARASRARPRVLVQPAEPRRQVQRVRPAAVEPGGHGLRRQVHLGGAAPAQDRPAHHAGASHARHRLLPQGRARHALRSRSAEPRQELFQPVHQHLCRRRGLSRHVSRRRRSRRA